MNRERLDIQIDVLEQVIEADRAFNMKGWILSGPMGPDKEPCKTACCAFGYAALDPRLQAEGLSLMGYVEGERRQIASIAEFNALFRKISGNISPVYNGRDNFEAAAAFYDITSLAAWYLFDPEKYNQNRPIEPEQVIERIHAVIANDGDAPLYAKTDDGTDVLDGPNEDPDDD